jgi:hypothetical protein
MYTLDNAILDLRTSADANPTKKAECQYGKALDRAEHGRIIKAESDCIVGDIMAREFHIDPIYLCSLGGTAEAALPLTVKHGEFSPEALLVLRVVQRMQDGYNNVQFPWGAAVDKGIVATRTALQFQPAPEPDLTTGNRDFQGMVERITTAVYDSLSDTEKDLYYNGQY